VTPHKRILALDIGGTNLKTSVIDPNGKLISKHLQTPTPHPAKPALVVKILLDMAKQIAPFDYVSIGFPGVVRGTHVLTAPNLGTELWAHYDLANVVSKKLGKPVRMANDADVQGLAVVKGKGLEFVVTLGTGFGTALYHDGALLPHLEIAHMPAHNDKDFDAYLGDHALKRIGKKKWNKRVAKMLPYLHTLLNYDHMYIGGGNSRHIAFKLPPKTSIVSNIAGLKGGAALWRTDSKHVVTALA
jgi:polyphosphate glucokinase